MSINLEAVAKEIMKVTIQHMADETGLSFNEVLDAVFVLKAPNAVKRYAAFAEIAAEEVSKRLAA